jgi:hypothetical protein
MAHAFLSPSGAPAWTRCLIKPWREKGLPDTSSEAADEGTAAHFLRDACLSRKIDAVQLLNCEIAVTASGAGFAQPGGADGAIFTIDNGMVKYVQQSIDSVRKLAEGGELFPEQALDISFITGEEGATGTADAVILQGTELIVDDLKYGRGVQVFAEGNEQLLIYAAAALEEYDVAGEIETVRMRISQPRLNHEDEWVLPVAELHERTFGIHKTAERIRRGEDGLEATPGDKQCRFCKVKGTCGEYRAFALGTVADGFVDLKAGETLVSAIDAEKILAQAYGVPAKNVSVDPANYGFVISKPSIRPQVDDAIERIAADSDERLATVMDAADMIEQFVKAVRAETERRLLAGQFTDPRYKLVAGKKGSRKWIDADEAEQMLKDMRLKVDEMYDKTVKSPTQIEKLLGGTPRRWGKVQQMITQVDGKPSVVPVSDKRPALSIMTADAFLPVEGDLA